MAATIPTNGIVLNSGLNVADGDITIASGHGISFAATSDGTGTDSSELLDDYEEGTFTPAFASSGATITHDTQYGNYTKIGRIVHVAIQLRTDGVSGGTSSTALEISGLPYTSGSGTVNRGTAFTVGYRGDFSGNGNYPEGGLVGAGSTTVAVYDMGGSNNNTAYSTLTYGDLGTGSNNNTLYFAGYYHTA